MNKCLYCGKEVKNKYCNTSCQNKHQNKRNKEKMMLNKYGENKIFTVSCFNCGNYFDVSEREKKHPEKEKYFCSRSCSNTRKHSKETREKISKSLKKEKILKVCEFCNKKYYLEYKRRNQRFCSRSCSTKYKNKNLKICNNGGIKSVKSQNRRSKNEIYFAELCEKHFNNILTNEQIFNGWDADIILKDEKIAVMWNGIWHYKKITEKHSIKQVQNRDKIKIKEIIKCEYKPYIIKDMGKYNEDFVKKEFEKFKKYIAQ